MRNSTLKFCAMLLAICTSTIHLQAMDEWDGVTIAKGFYSGTGTKSNPYRIFTASQFLYFLQQTEGGNTFSGKYIELCNDIAFSHKPIGGGDFYGNFDGNDHTIQVNSYWSVNGWTLFNLYGSMHDVQFVRANGMMSIYTGGILYNCSFEFPNGSYHGYWTVYLKGGTIANCVSNSAYYKNGSKYGGSCGLVYEGYGSEGFCSNCYFPITSYSYGNTLASNYYGVIENCGEEAGNDWVLSHTERAYKSWPLTFNPIYQDYNVTITFVDECGLVSYESRIYSAYSTIGELPIPNVDNTFLGWEYNGTYVQSTDVITHDMVLYADWKHEIKVQPTIYEPSVLCNDKEHATYQWYYQNKLPLQLENLSSGSSYVEITIPEDNLVLSFDFIAYGHTASGYSGDDEEAWICVDGEEIVYVWEPESGTYSCALSAGTHTITRRRSSLSNIRITYPTETLVDETSSTLSKQTIMNSPGAYFSKVTYSNNGDELISEYVDYEKLLTIDDVTYVVNEDSTATVLWAADKAVDIIIPEAVNYDDVDYPIASISSKAFADCTSLESVNCKSSDVPALLGGTTFDDLLPSNVTLYVPIGLVSAYSAAEGWSAFKNIEEFRNTYKATFCIDGEVVATYNIKEGYNVIYPDVDEKDGYSFVWDTLIDIMPSNDITIEGRFCLNNMVYFEDTTAFVNTTIDLPLQLKNSDDITAVQFDVYLPEGVTIEKTSRGKYNITFNEGRADNSTHTLSSALQADGAVRVLCYSTDSELFWGNEGAIFNFPLEVSDMEEGDYSIIIKNIILTEQSGKKFEIPSMTSTLNVLAVALGDCNRDNAVDVADIVTLANHILNNPVELFVEKAADFNKDNAVDVADIVAIANFILGGNTTTARALTREVLLSRAASAEYSFDILPFVLGAEGTKTISLDLADPTESFTAFQCDFYLPEGISINKNKRGKYELSFNEERTDASYHTLSGSLQADGAVRMLCYSTDSEVFLGTEGALINIPLTADAALKSGVYEFSIANTVLTYVDGRKVEPEVYRGSIIVGDGGEVESMKLYGKYTAGVLEDFSSALSTNKSVTSIDLTDAVSVAESGILAAGNPNMLVYLSENATLANENNVVCGDECSSLQLTDGYAFDAPVAFVAQQASYTRGLEAGKYGTIILPFTPSNEDYIFYELVSVCDNTLTFEEVGNPQANTPYLYSLRDGKSAAAITGVETMVSSELITVEIDGWQTVGSFAYQTLQTNDGGYYAYSASDNQCHRVTKTLSVKPFRAYLKGCMDSGAVFKTRTGNETLIDAAEVEDVFPEVYYDLSGRRVAHPTKGVYIVNGKKIVL